VSLRLRQKIQAVLRRGDGGLEPAVGLMSSTHPGVDIEGVPNKRLVFAALNKESAIVVYERGGYANFLCATILDIRDGSAWGSALNNYKVKNMHDLRAALAEEDYIGRRGGV
jgi:hypothetical protein